MDQAAIEYQNEWQAEAARPKRIYDHMVQLGIEADNEAGFNFMVRPFFYAYSMTGALGEQPEIAAFYRPRAHHAQLDLRLREAWDREEHHAEVMATIFARDLNAIEIRLSATAQSILKISESTVVCPNMETVADLLLTLQKLR